MGRDAISTYVNGRSYPTSTSRNLLCQALGMSPDALFPSATASTNSHDLPSFEMRTMFGHEGRAWLSLNRMVSFETAAKIAELLNADDKSASNGE